MSNARKFAFVCLAILNVTLGLYATLIASRIVYLLIIGERAQILFFMLIAMVIVVLGCARRARKYLNIILQKNSAPDGND